MTTKLKRFITFLIAIFILYQIIKTNNISSNNKNSVETKEIVDKKNNTNVKFEGNFIERLFSKIFVNAIKTESGKTFFENIIQPLDAPSEAKKVFNTSNYDLIKLIFHINLINKGQGEQAICGQQVEVDYQIKTTNNESIENQKNKVITLGNSSLDNIIVGMQLHEERNGVILDKDNNNTIVTVKLNKIFNPIKLNEIKIFDNVFTHQLPVTCGDDVDFSLKISRINGLIIYDQKITNFTLGTNKYPLILSHLLFSKPLTGVRTVILPVHYLKQLKLKINNYEYVILEIYNVKINNTKLIIPIS